MGVCSNKSKSIPQGQKVLIGGDENAYCIWKIKDGQQQEQDFKILGWEMRIIVDEKGTIWSAPSGEKIYSGYLKEGYLKAVSTYKDGAQISYDGQVDGARVQLQCKVLNGSSGFKTGDLAECVGNIRYM